MSFQTRTRTNVSYQNKYSFLKKLDGLPSGGSDWVCDEWEVISDVKDKEGRMKTEEVELWRCNPVDCIRELTGNPVFLMIEL